MKKTLAVLSLSILFLSACKKDVSELPAATQEGANTFGAKVDGALWIPQQFSVFAGTILEARWLPGNQFTVKARNFASSPTETEFELFMDNFTGVGTYPLNQTTPIYPDESASYGYFIKRKFMPLNEWVTNAAHTGVIQVTRYDTTKKIISGTFQFNAVATDSTTLSVTEGRFDAVYQ